MSIPCNIIRDQNIKPLEASDKLAGFGDAFPQNPTGNLLFTRTDLPGNPMFIWDADNQIWQQTGGVKSISVPAYTGEVLVNS